MEYTTNTRYPLSELKKINKWWQAHKQYDVNEYEDYIEIVERADNGAPLIIKECKNFLNDTDYIIVKIAEAETEEERVALREEYADIILQRKQARTRINELEATL